MYLQQFSILYFCLNSANSIADGYLEVEQGTKKRSSNTENKYLSLPEVLLSLNFLKQSD